MRLNKGKCEFLAFNNAPDVEFGNGAKVPRKQEAKYLGCHLNSKGDPGREISKRVAECTIVNNRLQIFWRHGDSTIKQNNII